MAMLLFEHSEFNQRPMSSREEGDYLKSVQTNGRQVIRKAHMSFQFRLTVIPEQQ